ncbi:hypothetical protein EV363DRAFT_1155534 [Boletus edulis]|uniref:ER membrane protein complex subunit 10 n=1 Tax=Boletus edulis BED1 TaxID=1328754 RepID=A0AAD4GM06_BOLED|nr:hypothetical protein EV363DRAFT_1155534 [Boletus edulis]KAF8450548.1 hypothetical protein L210DRAFT_3385658 [Boletus edulis BED1]
MYFSPLIALLLVSFADAQGIRVQHRVVHPNLPITPWSELGTVALPSLHSISPSGSHATLNPSDTLLDDLSKFTQSVDPTLEGAMYQVALERPGVTDDVWPTSVVKACHLPGSTSAHLTIHFSPSGLPFAVDHFVSPVPHDGSCPALDTHKSYPALNTTISLMLPRQPPQRVHFLTPELRTPPPLTAEGEPMAPAPEKSFLQKYWIYIVVILGVLLISGPADEPAGNGGGQGGR